VVFMLFGAIVWGFVIATLLNIANHSDPAAYEFRQTMEDLNRFMKAHGLPDSMRLMLREYVHESRTLSRQKSQQHLLALLSPQLLESVTLKAYVYGRPIQRVAFFSKAEDGFLAQVVLSTTTAIYPPSEYVLYGSVCVLNRGRATVGGVMLSKGQYWGDDCFLSQARLRQHQRARAITFIEVGSMSGEGLFRIALENGFLVAYAQLRRHLGFLALRREIMFQYSLARLRTCVLRLVTAASSREDSFKQLPGRDKLDQRLLEHKRTSLAMEELAASQQVVRMPGAKNVERQWRAQARAQQVTRSMLQPQSFTCGPHGIALACESPASRDPATAYSRTPAPTPISITQHRVRRSQAEYVRRRKARRRPLSHEPKLGAV
jgi:hypothetical protein